MTGEGVAAMAKLIDRYLGAMLGLAAGDALGTTLEFKPPGSFDPIDDMIGGGPFDLEPGQWTDDTSMALCLAESLIERRAFDPVDQLERYTRWYRTGHLSSNGRCFDIGNTVRDALDRFSRTRQPFCGSTSPRAAGNGSIMRLAPVALAYADRADLAVQRCGDSSRTTHATPVAVDACTYFGGLLVGALAGVSKETLLGDRSARPLSKEIAQIAAGSFKRRKPPEIRGTGYVVDSLEAALWALWNSDNFRDGALLAVNLGDDADTTGAVYGQLAGAIYTADGIPEGWKSKLAMRKTIEEFATHLLRMRGTIGA